MTFLTFDIFDIFDTSNILLKSKWLNECVGVEYGCQTKSAGCNGSYEAKRDIVTL